MKITSANDILIPAWEADRLVNKAHQIRTEWRYRIANAAEQSPKRLRRLIHSYFKDKNVKVSVLAKAGIRMPSTTGWLTEALLFDPFSPFPEPVYWWPEPKRSHGYRLVCDPPPAIRAAHYMIGDVIAAQTDLPPFIFNVKGKGRDGLARQLLEKLEQGFTCWRTYDVRDCYQSVDPGAIYQLKLPRRIINNALDMNNLNLQRVAGKGTTRSGSPYRDTIVDAAVESGPSGLMQGSPASNLILAFLLQTMPQPIVGDGYLFLYGDDLIVVARTQDACDRVEQSLCEFFAQPWLGPLPLQRKAAGIGGAFEFLGYEFRLDATAGNWAIDLSRRNWDELARIRHDTLLILHRENRHGIFSDDMKEVRAKLTGHGALTNPDAILDAVASIGPDGWEIEQSRRTKPT